MFSSNRNRAITNVVVSMCAGLALFLTNVAADAQTKKSQTKAEETNKDPNAPVIVKGKIVSITKKGRSKVLTVEAGGKQQDFIINSKIDFSVHGKGDKEFLAKGQFIQMMATTSNKQLFVSEVYVIAKKGGRKPKGRIMKAPMKAGVSKNAWVISGTVESLGQHPDYEKYELLRMKAGSKKVEILLEKGYRVTVVTNDTELLKEGAAIELEGRPGRGGRFTLARATVKLNQTFKAEDFIKKKTSRRKSSRRKTTSKNSKSSKSSQDSKSDKDSKKQ